MQISVKRHVSGYFGSTLPLIGRLKSTINGPNSVSWDGRAEFDATSLTFCLKHRYPKSIFFYVIYGAVSVP